MCGICGIVNFNPRPVQESDLRAMMRSMKHRGPDDEGVFLDGSVGLGFVRLSILDLSPAGHQPMFSRDGRYVIVFNGEIYNYVEIREELKDSYEFSTNSDTEVILAAYREWGEACLDRFNGMWALAIYDTQKHSVFLSRDRYGIKPFYYHQSGEMFMFASEMKSLHGLLKGTLNVDQKTVYEYLVYNRTDQTCDTFLDGIKRFQHGYSARISDREVRFNKWYDLREKLTTSWENAEEFRETFDSAVGIRLRSDVPVGVCLSGGLDSSSITSTIINEYGLNDLYTFSAVYGAGVHGDETSFIDLYKPLLPNLKYVHPTEKTFLEDFASLMDCHFEPFGGLSIYSQFKVMKEAKKFITVALDGQGADEEMGGYLYFFGSYFRGLLREFRLFRFATEVLSYLRRHKSTEALQYMLFYLLPNWTKNYLNAKRTGSVSSAFHRACAKESRLQEQLYDPISLNESLIQHFEYKLEHNLKWNDLNSMYFSIELRVPFLDYRIVEKTLATPADQIIHKGSTKWILREAMEGRIPELIRRRQDKIGFENPSEEWFKTPLIRERIEEAFRSRIIRESGFFDLERLERKYRLHLEDKVNIAPEIWKLVNMDYFLRNISEGS